MRAILIDPKQQTLEEIEISSDYREITRNIEAAVFTSVRLEESEYLYVDDRGLYNSIDYFALDGYPHPLAGRGIIIGIDYDGESRSSKIQIEDLRSLVRFIEADEAVRMAEAIDRKAREAAERSPHLIVMESAPIIHKTLKDGPKR